VGAGGGQDLGNARDHRLVQNKFSDENVVFTTVDNVHQLGAKSSLWPMTFGLALRDRDMMATGASRYDWDRFRDDPARHAAAERPHDRRRHRPP